MDTINFTPVGSDLIEISAQGDSFGIFAPSETIENMVNLSQAYPGQCVLITHNQYRPVEVVIEKAQELAGLENNFATRKEAARTGKIIF